MDAVTYPQETVAQFVSTRTVPLRIAADAQPYAADFAVKWTPTLVTLDRDGTEHHRTVGFLPAEELVASLLLGSAKCHFDAERFAAALKDLDELVSKHPKSDSAPEGLFLQGVAGYKHTHDPKPLKAAYEALAARYPDSVWAKRALPYRLL
ncbi:MAG: hypothetical protein ACYDA8_11380 [Deferrisomatales bacterium]